MLKEELQKIVSDSVEAVLILILMEYAQRGNASPFCLSILLS